MSATAGDVKVAYVDLSAPGALEKLKATNPNHYQKFVGMLSGLKDQQSRGDAARWIRTTFGAKEVAFSRFFKTTHPPLRNLYFTLDGVKYSATIVDDRKGVYLHTAGPAK
jgi:hypothetical protein